MEWCERRDIGSRGQMDGLPNAARPSFGHSNEVGNYVTNICGAQNRLDVLADEYIRSRIIHKHQATSR